MTARVLVGDVRAMLATLEPESVSMAVCSPPYWGLRSYGTEPQVWGGDGSCGEEHEWDAPIIKEGKPFFKRNFDGVGHPASQEALDRAAAGRSRPDTQSAFCTRCSAWRGELGSEPDPWQFIANLVEIFRHVRHVLHPTGTLWLNLGWSYAGSGKGPTGHNGIGDQERRQGFTSDNWRHSTLDGSLTKVIEGQRRAQAAPGFKSKDLILTPFFLAEALRADGWYLRSVIAWCLSGGTMLYARTQKGDMPQSVKDLARLDPKTVKLWNGERWTQVVNWFPNDDPGDPLELELRTGERIGCTPEHLWPTERGLLPASELKVGDVLKITRLPEPDEAKQPSALNDRLVGWLIGMYLAEGCKDGPALRISAHARETSRYERLKVIAESFHGTARWRVNVGSAATVTMYGRLLHAIIDTYIAGDSAQTKRLTNACWERSNDFLDALLDGYLEGDGHWEPKNRRWRIGFARNYALEANLRTLCARIGAFIRVRPRWATLGGRKFPSHRGEIRFERSGNHSEKPDGEIVRIGYSKGRKFWDIEVEDEPHTFALASGVLTHNCKKSAMPESVQDRPTNAWEPIFLLSKNRTYYYDGEAVRQPLSEHAQRLMETGYRHPSSHRTAPERGDGASINSNGKTYGEKINPAGASLRNFWLLGPEPSSLEHYAGYPTEIPRRAILAGTSERGVCPRCGAPWKRTVERTFYGSWNDHQEQLERGNRQAVGGGSGRVGNGLPTNAKAFAAEYEPPRTVGWQPGCKCEAGPPRPAVVLDCFAGSGTTGLVADRLGRDSVLIELSPIYAEMARKRIDGDAPLFSGVAYEPKPRRATTPVKAAHLEAMGKRTEAVARRAPGTTFSNNPRTRPGYVDPISAPPANGQAALPWEDE